jgi:hypothetical protein
VPQTDAAVGIWHPYLSFPEIENVPLAFGIVRDAMAFKQNNFCK